MRVSAPSDPTSYRPLGPIAYWDGRARCVPCRRQAPAAGRGSPVLRYPSGP